VGEVAGSGNAAIAGQRFLLKQAPLTHVSAATPDGRASTLEIRVDGLLWNEVPTLFGQGAHDRVYALRQDGDGNTTVQFGDGIEGSRLPSGRDNIRFRYRKFLGRGGNLDAGRLTTLLGRPLGVKTAANVTPASGGEDAESVHDARRNAPLTTLTLDRAVSIQDYTDFSRTFAGIAKAHTVWLGTSRGIFVTVAGPDGSAVDVNSDPMVNLRRALREYGDTLLPLTVTSYTPVSFRVAATITVTVDADEDEVIAAVESALRAHYSFDARDFAQMVSLDEIVAVMHSVVGVDGVDVNALYRADPGALPSVTARLFAFPAQLQDDGSVTPAEILTLDTGPLELGVMS
jgi:predicted phage baseplate assembly protein